MSTIVGPTNLIETQDLTKRYSNGTLAVDRLNLTIRQGEVYGFLGPNGAGKTTTLRMLAGLIKPTSGRASVIGTRPGSPASLARIGALIEAPAFWPYLSGRDNLRLLARYCRVTDRRVDDVLDEVGMTRSASRAFSAYSTGMRQRLGVAAALLKDPELLILDEPTNGLDPQGMAEFRDLIRRVGQGQRTVLLSSHLLTEVEHACSRVGVIRQGKLIAEGTIAEIRGASGLVVRAEPFNKARAVLEEMIGVDRVRSLADGAFSLGVDVSEASAISHYLSTIGVVITELRPLQRSLEDVFMELTGTESGS